KKPRTKTLLPWTTAPWGPELTVAAAAGGHHLAAHALDLLVGVTPHDADTTPEEPEQEQSKKSPGENKKKRRRRGQQPRKRLPSPREEVIARVPEAPQLL
ncbi:hypothetical protein G3I55_07580, partial [Streptomyces sp. SID6648]|nr:hypothetical protein [Streptomyces sp. SID6648]